MLAVNGQNYHDDGKEGKRGGREQHPENNRDATPGERVIKGNLREREAKVADEDQGKTEEE